MERDRQPVKLMEAFPKYWWGPLYDRNEWS